MSQPPVVQSPKYRRSWMGRLIVVALVAQWSALWVRSYHDYDELYLKVASVYFLGAESREGSTCFSAWKAGAELAQPGPVTYIQQSANNTELLIQTDTFWLANNFLIRIGVDEVRSFIIAPYLSLIASTLLVHFTIDWFRRWRFNRWAKRSGT